MKITNKMGLPEAPVKAVSIERHRELQLENLKAIKKQ